MQAFLAILRYDLGQLGRSWLIRVWVLLLAGPAVFLVVVSATEQELASETLALYLGAVLAPLSALAVAVITAAAIAGETATVADSIMSRSVTRAEYLWAKIVSRLGVTLLVYAVVTLPFAYLVTRFATHDTSFAGVAGGLLMVAAVLVFVAALGIAFSTMMRNVLMAVLVLLALLVSSGVLLQFLGLTWMSTTAVLEGLPETFRGRTPGAEQLRVLGVFSGLTVVAIIASLVGFRRRDL